MYAPTHDGQLYFVMDGINEVSDLKNQSESVLVALHGGPGGTHKSLRPILSKLSPELCVIYIDQRGSGQSFHASRDTYTLENNVRDLNEFRSFLDIDQMNLLGFSYGGMVAMSYAIQHPENVKRLVVVNSAPSFHFIEKARRNLKERGTSHQVQIAEKLWKGAFKSDAEYGQFFEELRTVYSVRAARGEMIVSDKRHVSHEPVNEAFSGFLQRYDIRSELGNITARTLVIGAEHDWMCPPEFSEDIAARIEDADLCIVPGSGHYITEDRPEELLRLISDFVHR
jgi:proline iminopeptidase